MFLPRTVVDFPDVSYHCKRKIAFGQNFVFFGILSLFMKNLVLGLRDKVL